MVNKKNLILAGILYLISLFVSIRLIQTTQDLFLIWCYGGIVMLSMVIVAESLEEKK